MYYDTFKKTCDKESVNEVFVFEKGGDYYGKTLDRNVNQKLFEAIKMIIKPAKTAESWFTDLPSATITIMPNTTHSALK